jgi:D-sedoheptulose 7-phosphate isomerase
VIFFEEDKMADNFEKKINSRKDQLEQLKHNHKIFEAIELIEKGLKTGHKILIFGNGGSATQSEHFASEMVNRFYFNRKGLPAVALTANSANVTSIGNDFKFEIIFSKQIEALARKGDIALGISTSGKSENILTAFTTAKKMNLNTVALCGEHVNNLENIGIDIIVSINSNDTPVIQEMHLVILHTIAEIVEQKIFKDIK